MHTLAESLGWLAASLTLASFASTDMLRLRVLALAANVAFVSYACQAGLMPVLALHLALAPVNLWRLIQLLRQRTAPASQAHPGPPANRRVSWWRPSWWPGPPARHRDFW
jgi:hypothetical protein